MVIHSHHTLLTDAAMMRPWRLQIIAFLANSEILKGSRGIRHIQSLLDLFIFQQSSRQPRFNIFHRILVHFFNNLSIKYVISNPRLRYILHELILRHRFFGRLQHFILNFVCGLLDPLSPIEALEISWIWKKGHPMAIMMKRNENQVQKVIQGYQRIIEFPIVCGVSIRQNNEAIGCDYVPRYCLGDEE